MKSLLLKGGTVMTMYDTPFVGDVRIAGSKIAEVGMDLPEGDSEIIDVKGKYIMPGLVDAHSHAGMDTAGTPECDHNELSGPVMPHMHGIDSIYPMDISFKEARECGITTCVTGPGSMNVIGGTFAAVKPIGVTVNEMLLKDNVAMKAAVGQNPKTYCSNDPRYPKSRMGIAAVLRCALVAAQNYKKQLQIAESNPASFVPRDLVNEALIPVIERKMPLKIHCHRVDDIMTAIRICNEFAVLYTLDHCTEGYFITHELYKAEQENCKGVIIGPLNIFQGKNEMRNAIAFQLPKALYDANIKFAIATDYSEVQQNTLIQHAALTAGAGVPDTEALRAVTLYAAEITGIDDRVGSITVGKDADIVVFSDYPLNIHSKCEMTIINGKTVYNSLI